MASPAVEVARSWAAGRRLLPAVVALTVVANAVALGVDLAGGTFLNPYNATQYYLTWQDGFVRRGFPGTVLHLLFGRDPTPTELSVVTAVATVLGLGALLVLVLRLARLSAFAGSEGVVLALLVASPLTFSMVLHNRSRLDPLVVALIVLLALLPLRVLGSRWTSALLAAGLAAAAVGSLELAAGFVVPVLLARALRSPTGATRWVRFAVEVAPALVLAGASVLLRPSPAAVARVVSRVAAAGIDPPRENSVSILANTLPEALQLNDDRSVWTRMLWFVVFAACFALTVWVLRRVARPGAFDDRVHLVLLGCCALTAGAVSVVGFDYGRWFSLALLGLLGSVVAGDRRPAASWRGLGHDDRPLPRTTGLLVVGVLAVSVVGQQFPVYPAWG